MGTILTPALFHFSATLNAATTVHLPVGWYVFPTRLSSWGAETVMFIPVFATVLRTVPGTTDHHWMNEWTNKRTNSGSRRHCLGTKEGISSWEGLMSNTHENTKHNSWCLLEAEKNICWNSVYCGLTSLLDEAIGLHCPIWKKRKIKSTKGKKPHSVLNTMTYLPSFDT